MQWYSGVCVRVCSVAGAEDAGGVTHKVGAGARPETAETSSCRTHGRVLP